MINMVTGVEKRHVHCSLSRGIAWHGNQIFADRIFAVSRLRILNHVHRDCCLCPPIEKPCKFRGSRVLRFDGLRNFAVMIPQVYAGI